MFFVFSYVLAPNLDEVDDINIHDIHPERQTTLKNADFKKRINEHRNKKGQKNLKTKFEKIVAAGTLRDCKEYDYWILLPDEMFSIAWNVFMMILYIAVFILIPYRVAFGDSNDLGWDIFEIIIDVIFLVGKQRTILFLYQAFISHSLVHHALN